MHLDNNAIFSDHQALTVTANSDNVLDMGEMAKRAYNSLAGAVGSFKRRLGVGQKVPLLVQVTEDFAGAATEVEFILQASDAENFGSGVDDVISVTVAMADLKAGYILPVDKLPRDIRKRYLRLRYVLDDTNTAGKVVAGIVAAVDGAYVG